MDKNLMEEYRQSLLNNNYKLAEELIKKIPPKEAFDTINLLAFDTEDISLYTFIVFLLLKKETAELHMQASFLLAMPFCFLKGGYVAGLSHARRALELDFDNINYKEYLLTFYNIPDQLISKEEALKLAREVLKVKPNSGFALRIVNET